MNVKQISLIGLLSAVATLSAHILALPVAGAKVFPVQHAVNVIAGVLLGPARAVVVAFITATLRNLLGTGTLLAFPGGMVGAFLAGYAYRVGRIPWYAAAGEVFGTGVIGALLSYPVAKFVMGQNVAALVYIAPFTMSSSAGAVIGLGVVLALARAGIGRRPRTS